MSKKPNTRSKNTEQEEVSVMNEPSIDVAELEGIMQSFNKEQIKLDICRQIKTFEATIEQESTQEGQEEQTCYKITMPTSGKVIRAKGESLRQACELVEAWNKSSQSKVQTANDEDRMQPSSMSDEIMRPQSDNMPKFHAVVQLPIFSGDEIYSRRFYQASEELNVYLKGTEWLGLEGLSRLVLLQALAQVDPESCANFEQNEIKFEMTDQPPYSCILDGVQFVQISQTILDMASEQDKLRSSVDSAEALTKDAMLTLKFHYTRRMADILREEAERERRIQMEKEAIRQAEEEAHKKKYAIVERIKAEMAAKEAATPLSLVDKYAMEAQAEFQMVSMKEIAGSGNFSCPQKYLNQRDQPLEVPMECIRKLCDFIDRDFDDRIELQELIDYVQLKELPIEPEVVHAMYEDAIFGRGYVNEKQRTAPLTHEEVASAVRGRNAWDAETKQWEIQYRPYRNEWIVLLLTINPRIFAMPMPRVIPSKITAQYEQEENYQQSLKMGGSATLGSMGMQTGAQGADRRYLSIKEIKQPQFVRDRTKNEANIVPDKGSTIKITGQKTKFSETNPYEQQIANRMAPQGIAGEAAQETMSTERKNPKVSFASQQVFNEVVSLSAKVPTWTGNKQNPINQFVPNVEQPYKTVSEETLASKAVREHRNAKLSTIAGKDRTLQLAGTMALKTRKMSPISKLRETRGIVTIKRVPDVTERKVALAHGEQRKEPRPEYTIPKTHEFKNYDTLAFGQRDWNMLAKPEPTPNVHNLSEFDKKPKMHQDRVREFEKRQIEADTVAARDNWEWSHKLAMPHEPLTHKVNHLYMKEKREAKQNLDPETWESAYTLLARTVKDDLVVGKPKFNSYIKPMKPEHREMGFSGQTEPFKAIE